MAMRARRKLDGEVMGGGGDNVCSGTGEIHRYTDTKLREIPGHFDCTLHLACVYFHDLSIATQS